jgi:FkbM family methyltransferase
VPNSPNRKSQRSSAPRVPITASSIREKLRSFGQTVGLEVRQTNVYSSTKLRLRHLLSHLQIDLVLDAGANHGQFARKCRACGYRGEIISFEAAAAAHATLLAKAAADPLWTVADRVALGATTGEAEINIASNSLSSSILPMLGAHLAAAPASRYTHREKVPVRRLDDLLPGLDSSHRIFFKLDVQGYESQVLSGAPQILSRALAVQLEMPIVPLYDGELLMPQMIARMSAHGFDLWDVEANLRDPHSSRLLAIDGVFTRRKNQSGDHT